MEEPLDRGILELYDIGFRLMSGDYSRDDFVEAFEGKFKALKPFFSDHRLDQIVGAAEEYDDAYKITIVLAYLFLKTDASLTLIRELFSPVLSEMRTWSEWLEAERRIAAEAVTRCVARPVRPSRE